MITTSVALQSAIWFYLALSVLCIQLSTTPALISTTLNETLSGNCQEFKITYLNCTVGNAIYQVIHTLHFSHPLSTTILNIQDPLQHNLWFFSQRTFLYGHFSLTLVTCFSHLVWYFTFEITCAAKELKRTGFLVSAAANQLLIFYSVECGR